MVTPSPIKKSALPELPRGSAHCTCFATCNTHAPGVIIGERMAEILKR